MASSRTSPGPHDRRDPTAPRPTCVQLTRSGKPCQRYRSAGSKLCKTHKLLADARMGRVSPEKANRRRSHGRPHAGDDDPRGLPEPTPGDLAKAGVSQQVMRQGASAFVIAEQARAALAKLGDPEDIERARHIDPKIVLLDSVHSAWRQRQVWEAMLSATPEEDWAQVGSTPIPGVPSTAKGARIEVIQKYLDNATKSAARISKLAIDAGIEERLVRLAEEQSALIADTVRAGVIAAISALQQQGIISPDDAKLAQEAALASAATHLRALAAGGQDDTIIQGVAQAVRAEPIEVRT